MRQGAELSLLMSKVRQGFVPINPNVKEQDGVGLYRSQQGDKKQDSDRSMSQ
jgi:hypothetical protein